MTNLKQQTHVSRIYKTFDRIENTKKKMYRSSNRYTGQVTTLIGDWSGTFVDKGSLAPKHAVIQTFSSFGISLTISEAGAPMGVRKDEHIRQILDNLRIKNMWMSIYNRFPNDQDINTVYEKLVSIQLQILYLEPLYSKVIPGTVKTINHIRNKYNIKIGLTTGFTKDMSDILIKAVAKEGLFLDSVVAGDEVNNGSRPHPNMLYRNLTLLGTYDIQSVVKVDDTIAGIREGLNAGCWTVGVRKWSTYTDYDSLYHLDNVSLEEIKRRSIIAGDILEKNGAHYVVDDVNNLPNVINDINRRLHRGDDPRLYKLE